MMPILTCLLSFLFALGVSQLLRPANIPLATTSSPTQRSASASAPGSALRSVKTAHILARSYSLRAKQQPLSVVTARSAQHKLTLSREL